MFSALHTIKSILKQNVRWTPTARYCNNSTTTPVYPVHEHFKFNFNGEVERRVRVRYAPSPTGLIQRFLAVVSSHQIWL